MNLSDQNVLLFARTMELGGTENVVLQLCETLRPNVNKVVVCSSGGVNVDKLTSLGIKHYKIEDIENKNPLTIFNTMKNILSIVRTENITVIHTHHRMAAFYVSLLRLYEKCYFINTSHNTFYDKKILTRFSYKNANLVACGEKVKENLVDVYKLPANNVTVIRNAVKPFTDSITNIKLFDNLRRKGYFLIGNIGRLSEQKGMEYFIRSIPLLIERYKNMRFIIIGSGELEDYLRDLVNELEINEYVVFLGYRSDIQNVMSQLDLIVLSSLWEGLPLTPIEAFSVGKTVIGTAVDGTVEIIINNENGLLVPPKDSNSLAKSIEYLYINKESRLLLEKNAFCTFEHNFSFSVFQKKYLELYEKLNK